MRVLLIDNYDSFVFNIAQYLGALGSDVVVMRSDAPMERLQAAEPDAIVISPGPGRPEDAGRSIEVIETWDTATPILGVCLGHQAIGIAFGGKVVRAGRVMHGKVSAIDHNGRGVFRGIPRMFEATRYHSLVIEPESVPASLEVTARAEDGTIMAVAHRDRPVVGVQFHPESVLTPLGIRIFENFVGAR